MARAARACSFSSSQVWEEEGEEGGWSLTGERTELSEISLGQQSAPGGEKADGDPSTHRGLELWIAAGR
jgi:hypothetical protein